MTIKNNGAFQEQAEGQVPVRAPRRLADHLAAARQRNDPQQDASEERHASAIVDSLKRQLDERTSQLRIAQIQLKKNKLELQAFSNAVSHDFRTPLRAISGFASHLQQGYSQNFDETANRYLDFVTDGASRLDQLITGLVQCARIPLKPVPDKIIDLRELYEDAMVELNREFDNAAAAVTCYDLPRVRGDYLQLTVLLQNLIENGLKFNESENPLVQIRSHRVNNHWIISVIDNGIGIPEEYSSCVLDIFRRLHQEGEFEGVGAGLAICRKIVEHHGGKIIIKSKEGHGTAVAFSLPAID